MKIEEKAKVKKIGPLAFYVGLILAILLGIFRGVIDMTVTTLVLGILGIIVGLLNIEEKEIQGYLIANVAFLIGGSALNTVLINVPGGNYLVSILQNVILFIAPGAAVVALKAIYEAAKEA